MAKAPQVMTYGYLRHPRAHQVRINRHESVHLAVESDIADHLRAIDLQRAAVIAKIDAGIPRDENVGSPTQESTAEARVLAVFSPPRDNVVSFLELGKQTGNIFGVVLKVGVDENQNFAGRVVDASHDRGCLAEIPA